MREAGADLAGLDEARVRASDVAGLEEPQHAEAVLDVALLDAVDVRRRPAGAHVRSTQPRQRPRSPLKPSPCPSRVPKYAARWTAPSSRQAWCARTQ